MKRGFGPIVGRDGVLFRLWAPSARRADLVGDHCLPLERDNDGWFHVEVTGASVGTRYGFRIDYDVTVPDPASRFQPDDVFGLSEVVTDAFPWRARDWRGDTWDKAAILEMHIGTFTREGTFLSAIERLDHIRDMGFTAIELMPVADFPGERNWGYDGVLWYAPDKHYGRPEDLKALVDAAHQRGLMVFLDVVYNHFGPEGNFIGRYAPQFFDSRTSTPWGNAIDYTVLQVRAFAIENALMWLDEFRLDGLRLDAVHEIKTKGTPAFLEELSRAVGVLAQKSGRHIHLMLENDENTASLLDPASHPSGKYRAQWNDDYHHAWHVLLSGETAGYYRDYSDALPAVARALTEGFVYQGDPSAHRNDTPRGEPSWHLAPAAFVNFLQNHDQIGNRAYGERLGQLTSPEALRCALVVTLLAPSPPMMFMGEEWGATQPFPFFCDFQGDLAEAVRQGRRREFAGQFAASSREDAPPDALSEATFLAAKLNWNDLAEPAHAAHGAFVRELLHLRQRAIVPLIPLLGSAERKLEGAVLRATWPHQGGGGLSLLANLSGSAQSHSPGQPPSKMIWGGVPPATLPAWSAYWWSEGFDAA